MFAPAWRIDSGVCARTTDQSSHRVACWAGRKTGRLGWCTSSREGRCKMDMSRASTEGCAIPTSADQRLRMIYPTLKPVRFAGEQEDGTTVEPGALETCHRTTSSETVLLGRTRAQHIPSTAQSCGAHKDRIHLHRPTCHSHFSLATKRWTIRSGLFECKSMRSMRCYEC
jgi:hypothetical protein